MADAANLDLPLDMFKEQAERRVSLGLILAKLVEENKLEPTEDQIKPLLPTLLKATKILKKLSTGTTQSLPACKARLL